MRIGRTESEMCGIEEIGEFGITGSTTMPARPHQNVIKRICDRFFLVELADRLEKYNDLGVLHVGRSDWLPGMTDGSAERLVEIADALGEPRLAAMLSDALAAVAAEAAKVPPELRPSDGRRHAKLVVPRSCRTRPLLRLRRAVRRAGPRLRSRPRVRTRVRGVLAMARRRSAT